MLANDHDPEGDALEVVNIGAANKGTVVLNPDGTLTYTPGPKAKGGDSFGYTIRDAVGNTASAMVAVSFQKGGSGSGNGNGNGNGKGKSKP